MKPISQAEAETLLSGDLPIIRGCLVAAWSDYHTEYSEGARAKHRAGTRANLVHDHVRDRARSAFEGHWDAHCQEVRGLFMVLLHQRFVLRFKKLDERLCASNIPTQQALDFVDQQLEVEGVDRMVALQAGYQLNALGTMVTGLFVTCPNGRRNHWAIELPLDDANDTGVIQFPSAPAPTGQTIIQLRPGAARRNAGNGDGTT